MYTRSSLHDTRMLMPEEASKKRPPEPSASDDDKVEEASRESFPASDPPAYTTAPRRDKDPQKYRRRARTRGESSAAK